MAKKSRRKKPGPPARYGYRPTLTIRLQEPVYRAVKDAAEKHGKSLSEEIEDMLTACGDLETAQRQLEDMRANTAKMHTMAASILRDAGEIRSTARVQAIRAAGLTILREIDGSPTRAVVELERLLAEADGIARGLLGVGFVDDKAPPPLPTRRMTPEEAQSALEKLEDLKRWLQDAASGKPDKVA